MIWICDNGLDDSGHQIMFIDIEGWPSHEAEAWLLADGQTVVGTMETIEWRDGTSTLRFQDLFPNPRGFFRITDDPRLGIYVLRWAPELRTYNYRPLEESWATFSAPTLRRLRALMVPALASDQAWLDAFDAEMAIRFPAVAP